MKKYTLWPADLRLFDGEGGAAPAAAPTAADEGKPESETQAVALPGRRAKKTGEFDNVVFGSPPTEEAEDTGSAAESEPKATPEPPEPPVRNRRAEYEKFKAEYKDLLDGDIQRVINRRFKASKESEAANKAQNDFIAKLHQIHGTATVEDLDKAIMGSDDYLQPYADKAGMSVPAYKEHLKTVMANAELSRAEAQRAAEAKDNEIIVKAIREAVELKKNPDFAQMDLQEELKDPEFRAKLLAGQSVKSAYLDKHFDQLVQNVRQTVAAGTEKRVTDTVRAKGNRPAENAAAPTGGKVYLNDVSRLTKAQRAEAARRAAKGEYITFK